MSFLSNDVFSSLLKHILSNNSNDNPVNNNKRSSVLEYIWYDSNGDFRSKNRVLFVNKINSLTEIPKWNFDASSTNQLIIDKTENNTEIILVPCAFYKSPFKRNMGGNSYIVLCELYDIDGKPHPENRRFEAEKIFSKYECHNPWYGYEQEYFITDMNSIAINTINPNTTTVDDKYIKPEYTKPEYTKPEYKDIFNKNLNNESLVQGQFYCGNGTKNIIHRQFIDEHMEYCIYAGLKMCGTNAEVAPGQWEFQIGPVEGIKSCDQLWVARFILVRLSEKYGYNIDFHPKIFKKYNGSGCHTNFSTIETREKGGYDVIIKSMPKFEENHKNHMKVYGKFNDLRLTGIHETAHINDFSYGIGTRHTSIRIGNDVKLNNEGYFEDRRPASNMEPYDVASIILQTFYQ
jgi:glutamine synthetase